MDLSSEEAIDRMALVVELTIPREVRSGVSLAFDHLAKAAAEIMEFPLSANADSDLDVAR